MYSRMSRHAKFTSLQDGPFRINAIPVTGGTIKLRHQGTPPTATIDGTVKFFVKKSCSIRSFSFLTTPTAMAFGKESFYHVK